MNQGFFYVGRTEYLKQVEEGGVFLFAQGKGFGKSLF